MRKKIQFWLYVITKIALESHWQGRRDTFIARACAKCVWYLFSLEGLFYFKMLTATAKYIFGAFPWCQTEYILFLTRWPLSLCCYWTWICLVMVTTHVQLIRTSRPPPNLPISPSPHLPTPVKTTVPQEVACFNYRWIPFSGAFIPYHLVGSVFPGRGI